MAIDACRIDVPDLAAVAPTARRARAHRSACIRAGELS